LLDTLSPLDVLTSWQSTANPRLEHQRHHPVTILLKSAPMGDARGRAWV
jgi:hypothetical protein